VVASFGAKPEAEEASLYYECTQGIDENFTLLWEKKKLNERSRDEARESADKLRRRQQYLQMNQQDLPREGEIRTTFSRSEKKADEGERRRKTSVPHFT